MAETPAGFSKNRVARPARGRLCSAFSVVTSTAAAWAQRQRWRKNQLAGSIQFKGRNLLPIGLSCDLQPDLIRQVIGDGLRPLPGIQVSQDFVLPQRKSARPPPALRPAARISTPCQKKDGSLVAIGLAIQFPTVDNNKKRDERKSCHGFVKFPRRNGEPLIKRRCEHR